MYRTTVPVPSPPTSTDAEPNRSARQGGVGVPAGDASSPRRRRASSGHACNHLSANPNLIPPPSCCLCALHAAAQNYAVLCRPGHRSPSSAADSRQQRPPSAPLLRHPPRAARPDGAGRSTRPPSPPNHPLSSCAPVSLYFRRPRGDLKPGRPDPRLAGRDPPANLDSHLSVCSVPDGIWVGDFFSLLLPSQPVRQSCRRACPVRASLVAGLAAVVDLT